MLLALEAWPTDSFTRAASFSFCAIILVLNVVWITIKIILWSHGYRGWFDTKDLRQLKELALAQAESTSASVYNVLRYSWRALFILLFVLPLTLLAISWITQHTH
jgi:hypothetical protein